MAVETTFRREAAPQTLPGLRDLLAAITRPKCPTCGKRAMTCCYTVPDEYREVAPRYFRCDGCAARHFKTNLGPWQDASGPEFDACYSARH